MVEGVDGEWDEDDGGDVVEEQLEEGEEDEMAKMMGFGGFGTSKVSPGQRNSCEAARGRGGST